MQPKELQIKDFSYDLPDKHVARYPLEKRDQSKLLIYQQGQISETVYANIAAQLPSDSFLVFNNTKVIEARLLFTKSNGSKIEIFCLEPAEQYGDVTTGMLQKGSVLWKCMVGGAKKWKTGLLTAAVHHPEYPSLTITAEKKEQLSDGYTIELCWNDPHLSFAEVLHIAGAIPLPPYLNRDAEESDKDRYQTIYAKHDGSVAAPTAGLHFTENVFDSLAKKNIQHGFVTLHVGAGTFKPVKSERMQDHEMHAEFIDVSLSFLETLHQQLQHTIISVGTTSLRTLESLYWIGLKTAMNPSIGIESLSVSQWEPYEIDEAVQPQPSDAILALIAWLKKNKTEKLVTKTQIIIAPGYRFRIAKALVTNFHQPQSTLLLLVSAITGEQWKEIYQYALGHDFRFLSYGDGSLLWI